MDTSSKRDHPFEVFVDMTVDHPIKAIRLSMKATAVIPNPPGLEFGDLYAGEQNERTFPVKALPGEELDVAVPAEYDRSKFDVRIAPPSEWTSRDACTVSVRCLSNAFVGRFEEKILLKTDRTSRLEILLTGRVLAPVEVEPSAISLGVLKPRQSKQVTVKLYSPYAKPFSVEQMRDPCRTACSWMLSLTPHARNGPCL